VKVSDVMTKQAVFCGLDATLAAAVALMRKGGCGFLPVVGDGGNVVAVITDRDIAIALGTRNANAFKLLVKEVVLPKARTFPKLFTCTPDDSVCCVLNTLRMEGIRRLPVIDPEGNLHGVLSIDDIALHAKQNAGKGEVSYKDVVETYQAICRHETGDMRPHPVAV